ncbi:MAG: hypothetical protein IJT70_07050 [Clostridia bacterium]|nr:hypothetical protein [Clostridia bacterium]
MITGFKDKKYALIGNIPSPLFPQRLHGMLADYSYKYVETNKNGVRRILEDEGYDGFHITYPLKESAYHCIDNVSEAAEKIGCVNVAVRRDGVLFGDNTEYSDFMYLLTNNNIDISAKKVLILGSGSSSKAVKAALLDNGADEAVVVSRNGAENYSSLDMHDDTAVIVNTTPVGMTPNYTSSPLSLRYFKNLEAVIDIVYDPFRTELMLQAEQYGIPAYGGIDMLLHQSKSVCEAFTGRRISDISVSRAGASLEAEIKNIVLVGMPGCGKSRIALEIARSLGRELHDTDDEISRTAGLEIPEIYELFGEDYFRQKETEIIKNVARGIGSVIASGAGAILKDENIKELRRRSTVVFLRREIERLATQKARIGNRNTLMKLYKERIPLYLAASDLIVDVEETPKDTAKAVIKAIYKK